MNRPQPTDQARRILEITRVFPAPRERVFQAFVDPELIALWWGPDGFHTPRDRLVIEPQVGGRHHKIMVLDDPAIAAGMGVAVGAEFPDSPRVLEIKAPELLVLSSDPQPQMGLVERTITRIEFHAEGPERTRVVLIDGPYTEMMAPHADTGWRQSFEKLAAALAG
ncbi:SRPBCC family protein [Dokdonella koreensis]|uniref:Activator of Hsp90 ATPase homologue 1/2-like C-terminal domain-containing protein n=1 Tax=Dokdonella koreensis DS-123 TaxID=1300342 RepID=A0A167GXJ0_9GAMM|nr:SRPBCC domain-containing protein [Dokdonella koreensis]ANB18052.1 Hypothetical protein I596_2032 [Dokdonella koreensis DS-123]